YISLRAMPPTSSCSTGNRSIPDAPGASSTSRRAAIAWSPTPPAGCATSLSAASPSGASGSPSSRPHDRASCCATDAKSKAKGSCMTTTELSPAVTQTPAKTWLLSSDSHIVEPPDLWTSRTSDERLPHVVREADGDWWYIDGRKTMSFLGIQTGMRFEKDPTKLRTSATFEEVSPAAYDPGAYLAANEEDGVWGAVIYPSEGLVIFSVPNTEVVTASMAAYNDWIAEFCSHETGRLKGIGMVNVDDPADATAELRRCHSLGLAGALITVAPPTWLPYRSREFDGFWSTAEELQMPLSLHVGTDRGDPRAKEFVLNVKNVPPSVFVNKDYPIRRTLADLMFSGVFERHPGLRIGTVE